MMALAAIDGVAAPPCAGFNDVDALSSVCPNVEWIRNRGVTLGCAAGLYCPNQSVRRDSMAAFLNRLGEALTPHQLLVDTSPGAADLDNNTVVCQTANLAVTGFPRRAYLDLAFAGIAPAAVDLAANLVVSTNSGASWTQVTTLANRGSIPANGWGSLANLGTQDLTVGQSVRFGVRLNRVSGSADLSDSRCNLRVLVISRDGASSPF
jgi:hypothetical protein